MSDTVWDKDIDNCLAVGLIILLVGGIVLNGFAQYFQYSILKRQGFSATVFYFSILTVVDVLTLLFSVPIMIMTLLKGRQWDTSASLESRLLCNVTGFIHNFASRAALYVVLLMAVGRLYAMARPFQYRRTFNKERSYCMIAAIWTVPALLSLLPFIKGNEYLFSETDCLCTYKIDHVLTVSDPTVLTNWIPPYVLLIILPTTVPGFSIILLLFVTLVKMFLLHRNKARQQRTNRINGKISCSFATPIMTKATKTLLVLIFSFSLTYLWWWTFTIWQLLTLMGLNSLLSIVGARRTYLYLLQMTMINVYMSCVTDPLVYLTLACRRSDLKGSTTKMTGGGGDTNPKTRGRVYQVAYMTADLDAAAKVTSQVTACEGDETTREMETVSKEKYVSQVATCEGEEEDTLDQEGITSDRPQSRKGIPEDSSDMFTCTEL